MVFVGSDVMPRRWLATLSASFMILWVGGCGRSASEVDTSSNPMGESQSRQSDQGAVIESYSSRIPNGGSLEVDPNNILGETQHPSDQVDSRGPYYYQTSSGDQVVAHISSDGQVVATYQDVTFHGKMTGLGDFLAESPPYIMVCKSDFQQTGNLGVCSIESN